MRPQIVLEIDDGEDQADLSYDEAMDLGFDLNGDLDQKIEADLDQVAVDGTL